MASSACSSSSFYAAALENHLISMARTVEASVNRTFEALLSRNAEIASGVFLIEPRINESEILVDEHAVRLLRTGDLSQEDVRHIVATLKINNDLEWTGDLAVNICQCVMSLRKSPGAQTPPELASMVPPVRAMVARCLDALIHRNLILASEVLQSEEAFDRQRDRAVETLISAVKKEPSLATPIFNTYWPPGTSNALRITLRISPKTWCSGCTE